MKSVNYIIGIFIFLVALFLLTAFTVNESERALVSRLGKFIVYGNNNNAAYIYKPGLHFRIPLIDKVHYFDNRLRIQDVQSSSIMTSEKKYLSVTLFVKWRIKDFQKFFNTTENGKLSHAEGLLNQKIIDGLRAEFTHRTVKNVISAERLEIMQELLDSTKQYAENLGLEVVDARIKHIEFPESVRREVYERMSSERQAEASRLRATGVSEANAITAQAEAQTRVSLAEGMKIAQEIRGEGVATAAKIYAEEYGKDKNFFDFYRSLEAYRESFGNNYQDILVLQPDNDFFTYFKQFEKK